jgi:hypothetical protein
MDTKKPSVPAIYNSHIEAEEVNKAHDILKVSTATETNDHKN